MAKVIAANTVSNVSIPVPETEPKAEAPMADLAKRTGGQFTVIGKDGKPQPGGKRKKK